MNEESKNSSISLEAPEGPIHGTIRLPSSKSLSNRYLIINALCDVDMSISNLSMSDDTQILKNLLEEKPEIYDVNHAGTSARFLCAFLSFQSGSQILTGSDAMKIRPMTPIVKACENVGAHIEYLEKEGFLPLKINAPNTELKNKVKISGSLSSQFISALLLVAPTLPAGLEIEVEGNMVSTSYIDMTIQVMSRMGVSVQQEEQVYKVLPQSYIPKEISIEADWSAASYFYGMASLRPYSKIKLLGLQKESLQGDSDGRNIFKQFNINTSYDKTGVSIESIAPFDKKIFEYDFLNTPDLFQTLSSTLACLGITGLYSGLETLKHKETDRLNAMKQELKKGKVYISELPNKFSKKGHKNHFLQEGKIDLSHLLSFDTYHDHRMAMSLSLLSLVKKIKINDPVVVSKSYPNYWGDLEILGWTIDK